MSVTSPTDLYRARGLFSPLSLLEDTGRVPFDFQCTLHGGSRNAENICWMSIMSQAEERQGV